MTNIIQASGATRTSLVNIVKHQMIDAIIESNVDPSDKSAVVAHLKKANFGTPAIEALADDVAASALEMVQAK